MFTHFQPSFFKSFTLFLYFFFLVPTGRPQPTVRWLINGLPVDDQYEHNSGDVIENRLLWPQIQRNDLNSIFTCQASNTKLVEPKETSFVLDMHCELLSVLLTIFFELDIFAVDDVFVGIAWGYEVFHKLGRWVLWEYFKNIKIIEYLGLKV